MNQNMNKCREVTDAEVQLEVKFFPSCESMCVCCPALRPSSRRPVKRYKKLLAEIFPETPNVASAKNPLCIPKIAKFLEQRSHKELRAAHLNYVEIITEAYSKLLFICKEQMSLDYSKNRRYHAIMAACTSGV